MSSRRNNRRMSLGGGALRDASSLQNSTRSSSSASRRMSIGGYGGSHHGTMRAETPQKSRHALLEEYRHQQKRARDAVGDDASQSTSKHTRLHQQQEAMPPLPRQHANPLPAAFVTEGSTALERFRMRKLLRLQQQQQQLLQNSMDENLSYHSFEEPAEDTTGSFRIGVSDAFRGTPAKRSAAVGHSFRPSNSFLPLSSSQEAALSQQSQDDPLSQQSVESAARVSELQKRVDELAQEKIGITIAMAPLEARFRQKEDMWMKEQNRLLQEIESLKRASRESDERYRDLEVQFEAKDEENRQLRMQVRKQSSSLYSGAPGSSAGWSRQLQNDRDVAELKEKLRHAEEEKASLRLSMVSVEKELHATKIELDSIVRSYEELQDEYEEVAKSTSDHRDAEIQLEKLTTEHIATSAQLNAVCTDLAATKAASAAALQAKEEENRNEVEQLRFQISVLKTRASEVVELADQPADATEDYAVLKAHIEERDRKIAELEAERLEWEKTRRQMHNRIQELRGNIRVFVRTRPFLPNDGRCTESAITVSPDGESMEIFDARTGAPHDFKFDKVFPPSAGQDHVFQEVSDFVQSALDGYHVCLFSYGQTGSGKTHTMQGSGSGAMRGIIPRAVEQILKQSEALMGQRWNFQLSASFLEIYNEDLKDLLCNKSSGIQPIKLSIKRTREGKSYVEGLAEVPIDTTPGGSGMQQLDDLMAVAARARSVASTKMNAQSSRSHSVFMLHLRGYNDETGAEVDGALNLCDLAGSERLDRSGAASDVKRLRETQSINKSLSCLGDVFSALAQGASHVPYRNSKLTYLLQDCLSGDGKALMFVNLSPTTASSNESLCSLRFAQRVNTVELGKATKHIKYRNNK